MGVMALAQHPHAIPSDGIGLWAGPSCSLLHTGTCCAAGARQPEQAGEAQQEGPSAGPGPDDSAAAGGAGRMAYLESMGDCLAGELMDIGDTAQLESPTQVLS
jgi:hypothetical protein